MYRIIFIFKFDAYRNLLVQIVGPVTIEDMQTHPPPFRRSQNFMEDAECAE